VAFRGASQRCERESDQVPKLGMPGVPAMTMLALAILIAGGVLSTVPLQQAPAKRVGTKAPPSANTARAGERKSPQPLSRASEWGSQRLGRQKGLRRTCGRRAGQEGPLYLTYETGIGVVPGTVQFVANARTGLVLGMDLHPKSLSVARRSGCLDRTTSPPDGR